MAQKDIKKFELDMCSGSVFQKMLLFAGPLMFSGILQMLFNAADSAIVGRYAGDNSLAAVGSTASLIGLITQLFIGLSVGANVLAARYYGAKEKDAFHETVHTAVALSLICGMILTVIGIWGAERILTWMDTPAEVLGKAVLYLQIYFTGITATMVYNYGSAILRAIGDTKRPLYFLFFAGALNVLLNLFFVIEMKLDVAGVGIATVLSQSVSAVLIIRCLMQQRDDIRLELNKIRLKKDKLTEILRVGLPAGFQGTLFSLSNAVIQSSINSFGAIVVAGTSAAYNVEGFSYTAMGAFSQAAISFTGQNIGARKYERVNRILLTSLAGSAAVGFLYGSLMLWKGEQLLGLFTSNQEVLEAGMIRLLMTTLGCFLWGMMDTVGGCLRGLGYSLFPTIVSLLGVCGFRLLWVATVFQLDAWHTPVGLNISYPISWAITFVVLITGYAVIRTRLEREWNV